VEPGSKSEAPVPRAIWREALAFGRTSDMLHRHGGNSRRAKSMSTEKLTLIRPDRREHRAAIHDFTGKAFGYPYWAWLTRSRESYFDQSHYDWSASTIGLLGGRIVTHWGVWGFDMRVGTATLRVAGIGAVCTHGGMRRRGLMARTIAAACEAMRDAGYDASLLFGIGGFYHRFGYVRAWPDCTYVVRTERLPTGRPAGKVRKIAPRHRPELARLYNRCHAGRTGTAVRPTYLRRGKEWEGRLWTDGAGHPAGYLFFGAHHGSFHLGDHAGEAGQVLRVLGRVARRRGEKEIRLSSLHHDSELARRLRRGDCRVELGYHESGSAMIRTLNLRAALAKLAPELSRRLRLSHLADWSGRLAMADSREKAALEITGGKVRAAAPGRTKHAIRGGDAIAQLLIGTDEPAETIASHALRLSGDAKELVGVLFPNQHPMLGAWDHF